MNHHNFCSDLTISSSRDYFLRGGKPWFYLADTAWSAFTNPTMEEWEYYLDYRKSQGFNVLQINILPQGDRSNNTRDEPKAFFSGADGKDDYHRPNPEYFKRAGKMVAMAAERGFIPALVLLWGDRVCGTWSNKAFKSHHMPLECVEPYVKLAVDTFAKYRPIWYVSGDTDFPEESKPWFKTALKLLKDLTPLLFCSFHMGADLLPEDLAAENPGPDFYTFQSGHDPSSQDLTYKMAFKHREMKVKRPVINSEPCYEAIGGKIRFSAFDVRRAIWWSLLSGAKAGVSYGAHGVWSWHREGAYFCAGETHGLPLDWRSALKLPGAWDAAFAKKLFEMYRLMELDPRQDLLSGALEHTRISAAADVSSFAVYQPYNREIKVKLDLSGYQITGVNLAERRFEYPKVTAGPDLSRVAITQSNADVLVIGVKE
ncbi:MAG: DUF4038 domain-containing protein [Bacillota bacterium]